MNGWIIALIILAIIGGFVYYNPTVKDSITGLFSGIIRPSNAVKLIPSEMEEYRLFGSSVIQGCAGVEALGESQGISDMKQKVCREACGKRNMDYSYDDCEKDLLVCYCIA